NGHDGHREKRRMRAVAAGRLSIPPDPVARGGQNERREAERAERRGVDEQAREEAPDGAGNAAAEQGEPDERDEQDVRNGAEDMYLGEDRDLSNRRNEEQGGGLDAVAECH